MENLTTNKVRTVRYLWLSLIIILTIVVVILIHLNSSYINKITVLKEQAKILKEANSPKSNLSKEPEIQLRIEGLQNPTEELTKDLMKHTELIPYNGTLGGKVGFYSEKNIKILNSRWVLANFDDGHISGAMLLEYKVSKNGIISWRVIDSFLL